MSGIKSSISSSSSKNITIKASFEGLNTVEIPKPYCTKYKYYRADKKDGKYKLMVASTSSKWTDKSVK